MKREKKLSEQIVSRVKFRKRSVTALFAVIVILTFLFLGDSHYYDGLEVRGVGLGLHPLIVVAVVVLECVAAVALYSRAEASVEHILDDDCDPKLYAEVKRALTSRGSYLNAKHVVDLNVSYYLGDFASCVRLADEAIHAPGDPDKLYGYSFLGMSAFHLGDKKELALAAEMTKRLLDRTTISSRTPLFADLDRRRLLLETLLFSIKNERENAVRSADSLEALPADTTALERYNTIYLRGIVYEAAGEKKKALSCFGECVSGTEKTFICEEAKKHI